MPPPRSYSRASSTNNATKLQTTPEVCSMCGDQCRRQMLEIGRAMATPFPRPHGRSSAHMASDHLRVDKDARRRLDTTATRSVFDVYFFICLPCRGPSYQYIKLCILPSNITQFSLSSCARCQQVPEFNVGNESSTLSAIGSRTPRPDRVNTHNDIRCRPRTLPRTTHQRVGQETLWRMCANTVDDATSIS